MSPSEAKDLCRFLLEADLLGDVPRAGFVVRRAHPVESVGAHTAGTALLTAMVCDRRPDLDKAKAVHMALLHDLTEVRTMDVPSPYRVPDGRDHMAEMEAAVAVDLFKDLPEFHRIWLDLHQGQSPEAKLVMACDKFQMLVRVLAYEKSGVKSVSDFWPTEPMPPLFDQPMLRDLYQGLLALRQEQQKT